MRKRYFFLIILFALSVMTAVNAYSSEPAIHEVVINVALAENGDARITEVWDVTVTGGTEWYLSLNNMKNITINNLSVTDETGTPYTFTGEWDVDKSLVEKANKCGIVDKGAASYEICWGVGSYGRRQFTVTYTLSGLVRRYADYAGFNHTFLSKDLSSPVDNAVVMITYPGYTLDASSAAVWAFGYNGYVNFYDNAIIADNETRLSKQQGIIIMAQFDNSFFPTAQTDAGSFEKIKSKALEGTRINPIFIALLPFAVLLLGFAVAYAVLKASLPDFYYRNHYGQARDGLKKTARENRSVPLKGELMKIIGLLNFFGETPSPVSIINYYMLKWVNDGLVTGTYFTLNHAPEGQDYQEKRLYQMLYQLSDNGRLSEQAIEQWAYKKYTEINQWYADVKKSAADEINREDLALTAYVKRSFAGGSIVVLNEKGWAYAETLYGFKNYLKRLHQDGVEEEVNDALWSEYLLYADLLNIYDAIETMYDENYTGEPAYGYYYVFGTFREAYVTGDKHRSGGEDGNSASFGGGGGATGGGGGGSR